MLWIEFTSVETVGVEGAAVEVLCCLVGLATDEGWIEPTTSSTEVSAGGLVGSVQG